MLGLTSLLRLNEVFERYEDIDAQNSDSDGEDFGTNEYPTGEKNTRRS